MFNSIATEDKKPHMENFVQSLNPISVINIVSALSSVQESIESFRSNISADMIFCKIQLPDGLSFELFCKEEVRTPLILVSGDDRFPMNAFGNNRFDYLPMTADETEFEKALQKYKMLQDVFANKTINSDNTAQYPEPKKRTRLLVKRGTDNFAILLSNVVLFYTKNKLVHVIDQFENKYIVEKNLSELEYELDERVFFRANRQYIINVDYVKSFSSYEKVKLKLNMSPVELNKRHHIIISQEAAPEFREWISGM